MNYSKRNGGKDHQGNYHDFNVEVNTRMNGGSWDEEECNDKMF